MSKWGFDTEQETASISTSKWGFTSEVETEEEQQVQADPVTEGADAVESWAQDQERMKNLSTYMEQRYGEEGYKRPEESNTDYVKRFLTHARSIENNSMYLMSQIDYLREANDEQRIAFGTVYDEYNKLPMFADGTARAVKDTVTQMLFDPINLFSLGVGRIAASTVGKVAVKEGLKRYIPKKAIYRGALAAGATSGVETVGFEAGLQEVERKGYVGDARPDDKVDLTRLAIAGGLGTAFGAGLGAVASIGAKKSARQAAIDGAKKPKSLTATADATASKNAKEGSFDPLLGDVKFDEEIEKSLRDLKAKEVKERMAKDVDFSDEAIYKDKPFLQPEVLTSLSVKMTKVVENLAKETKGTDGDILKNYSTFKDKDGKIQGRKVFDIVEDILNDVATKGKKEDAADRIIEGGNLVDTGKGIDIDALERAIVKTGMTKEEFIDFLEVKREQGYRFGTLVRVGASEGATKLGAGGELGKMLKVLNELAPEQKDRLNKLYGKPEETSSILGSAYRLLRKADRERRALMVTQIATTVRNVATGISVVGFQTAANLMEASIYHFGKSVRKKQAGKNINPAKDNRSSISEIIKDSFGLLSSIVNQQNSDELSRFVLRHNPKQLKTLLRTVQEAGSDADLSNFTMFFNKLNLAQDVFFRRAFFSNSVDKKLRRAGVGDLAKNIYTADELKILKLEEDDFVSGLQYVLKTEKDVPLDILKSSVDEALGSTFALMPKNGVARNFIKAIEGLPGVPVFGTGEFPFARFMANALAFQFRYSFLNSAVALTNGAGYIARKARGKVKTAEEGQRALEDFATRFSEGAVGNAVLAVAYYYRSQNQDIKWYEGRNKENKTIDLRPFFPLAPYLIIADIGVKLKKGEGDKLTFLGDIVQGLTGSQFRAGAASYTLNRFYDMFSNPESRGSQEKIAATFGQYMGEIMGGYLTPARVLKDVVATFDAESAIVRDPRQIEGEGFERGFDAFLKTTFHKNSCWC